jgi:hypothetical protein
MLEWPSLTQSGPRATLKDQLRFSGILHRCSFTHQQ